MSMTARSVFSTLAAVVCCAALSVGLAGCGSAGSRKSERRSGASEQEYIDYQLAGLGEKRAESLDAFIDQRIVFAEKRGSEKAVEVLKRAKANGGVSASDYEALWMGYKQCMLDRGYKEIILIKYPNGMYNEAAYYFNGTPEQEQKFWDDQDECMKNVNPVDEVYGMQVGNVNLYSNPSEAIVDCMHRNGAAPMSYTVNDYVNDKATGDPNKASINVRDIKVRECEVANNWFSSYNEDPLEHPF
ncbi:hypothetical protein [Bifidobacterium leontopitheci]|uniref:Uncharacterized protein n=1 Tax=Bifidobacterium leontopitheci TaxID=2650774 RepID=A0A6I1GQ76_9BIFI|nr:hypothetical protein [Bifidobacterium leontopitheci]KAB7790258.1 hypothetical protein F7D09_1251 [Bifidobacterium leontopitheci]